MSEVHRKTATELFGVPEDQVTPERLHAARVVNFGTLYGMSGPGSLAEEGYVRIARILGADSATCRSCGTTTHRKVEGKYTKVAEHTATCSRRTT